MYKNNRIHVPRDREVLSLITGVTYAIVPSWYDASFRDLKMDLILPKHKEEHKKWPVIVWICGGAFMVNDRSVWIPELVYFARNGFAVASIDYRTSNEAPFPAPLEDVKRAIRYLKAHAGSFCVDPEKVFIMGESAGGTLACLAGTTYKNSVFEKGDYLEWDSSVRAVVDYYGLTNLNDDECLKFSENVPEWTIRAFLGTTSEAEYGPAAETASAVCGISEDSPPFMILHGTKDSVVPISQSTGFYEKLKERNVESEMWLIEGAEHGDDMFFEDSVSEMVVRFLKRFCR